MNEIILHGTTFDLDSPAGVEFIIDCTRAGEGLLTDSDVRDKYDLSDKAWAKIAKNKALAIAIRRESERRVRAGITARERAARHFAQTPEILGTIANDAGLSPRSRIEACREIRATASDGDAGSANSGVNFVIKIDLTAGGGGVETYEHVLAPKTAPVIESEADDIKP
jgi:hypothetical protein